VPEYSHLTVTLNFVFLGVVSFIPFPTSMLSNHPDQPLAVIIFVATYVAGAVALAVMWRDLRKSAIPLEIRKSKDAAARWIIVWIPAAGVATCVLAFVDTRLSLLAWVLVLMFGLVVYRRDR